MTGAGAWLDDLHASLDDQLKCKSNANYINYINSLKLYVYSEILLMPSVVYNFHKNMTKYS